MFASLTYRHITSVLALFAVVACMMLVIAPSSSGASRPGHHLVQPGETLWSIASSHYHTSDPREEVFQVEQANNLVDATIVPGQVIVLP
jgi:LysM repeat protein